MPVTNAEEVARVIIAADLAIVLHACICPTMFARLIVFPALQSVIDRIGEPKTWFARNSLNSI
jgi:hypothetical protein